MTDMASQPGKSPRRRFYVTSAESEQLMHLRNNRSSAFRAHSGTKLRYVLAEITRTTENSLIPSR